MKNYQVKYTKGHLVDKQTGKKILLKRGGDFNILGDDDQFEEIDELQINTQPLNSDEKFISLIRINSDCKLEKIASAGTNFVYRIGLSKKTSEDNNREFLFNAIIKEDLYLYSKNSLVWNLCPCLCLTTECLDGKLQMIESVHGNSLSNLFANVVTFYFSFQRSTACNAFKTFHFFKMQNPKLYNFDSDNNPKLDIVRKEIIKKYSEKN